MNDNVETFDSWFTHVPGEIYEVRFRARADALAEFFRRHGRWPADKAEDAEERSLRTWHLDNHSRVKQVGSAEPGSRVQYLNDVAPGWFDWLEDEWFRMATAVAEFKAETGAWPVRSKVDHEVTKLAYWLQRQRRQHVSRELRSDRREHLDVVAPRWVNGRDELCMAVVDEIVAFRLENGRMPVQGGGIVGEGSLAFWLKEQRAHLSKEESFFWLSHKLRDYMDDVLPGWRSGVWF